MIILAAAIILALNSSNITGKATWARIASDRANLQAEYVTILANVMTEKGGNITLEGVQATDVYKEWAKKVKESRWGLLSFIY